MTAPGAGMTERRVVVLPAAPVLLPESASLTDPVAELRAACVEAVAWLGDDVEVIADDAQGVRIGEALLGRTSTTGGADVLVLANGSARRTEKAPGHLDDRAAGFDQQMGDLLARGDVTGLAQLDTGLAAELLACGLDGFAQLADAGLEVNEVWTEHADDPFGVMYWVVRWQCAF